MTDLRLKFACVLVLAAGLLGGCASGMTFDAPYDYVVTELRELYPGPPPSRDAELRRGRRGREERQRLKEQERLDKKRRAELAGRGGGPVSFGITYTEPSSGRRSVIRIRAVGPKTIWKRHAEITIRKLGETRTAVSVRCDYLQTALFGYSRSRDQRYERERLAEISIRLTGQSGTPNASRKKKSIKGKS